MQKFTLVQKIFISIGVASFACLCIAATSTLSVSIDSSTKVLVNPTNFFVANSNLLNQAVVAGGGSQTPWTSTIDANGNELFDVAKIYSNDGQFDYPNLSSASGVYGMYFSEADGRIGLTANDVSAMIINSSGDFGFGTDSPASRFHIAKDLGDINYVDTPTLVRFSNTAVGSSTKIILGTDSASSEGFCLYDSLNNLLLFDVGNSAINVKPSLVIVGSEPYGDVAAMVGVGLTNPIVSFHVKDTAYMETNLFVGSLKASSVGVITNIYSDTDNSTTTETTMYSYTLPADAMRADGTCLDLFSSYDVTCHATATTTLKFKIAGTTVFDSTALTLPGSVTNCWQLQTKTVRTGSSTSRTTAMLMAVGASTSPLYSVNFDSTDQDWTITNHFTITAQKAGVGAASNQIRLKQGKIEISQPTY